MGFPLWWRDSENIRSFRLVLGITEAERAQALRETRNNYIQYVGKDRRTGKLRERCFPRPGSCIERVQQLLKSQILKHIDVSPQVQGYRKGSHNISASATVCGLPYQGSVDISKFHPSITLDHVVHALVHHGLSWAWARQIAKLTTFRDRVPQGACTSNHIANLVIDVLMRQSILPFTKERNVIVVNYGDDICFGGYDRATVKTCVRRTMRIIAREGFTTNEKGYDCQHRGEQRLFIGCNTGRSHPDYPRTKYRLFRCELREVLCRERSRSTEAPITTEKEIRSLQGRIGYISRLNKRKARALRNLFYRICAARNQCPSFALAS